MGEDLNKFEQASTSEDQRQTSGNMCPTRGEAPTRLLRQEATSKMAAILHDLNSNISTSLRLKSARATRLAAMLATTALLLAACAALASARLADQALGRPGVGLVPHRPTLWRQELLTRRHHHQDLAAADQLDEPMTLDAGGELVEGQHHSTLDATSAFLSQQQARPTSASQSADESFSLGAEQSGSAGAAGDQEEDAAMETNSQEAPERNLFLDSHNSNLRAMRDMFERRQLHHHQQHHHRPRHVGSVASNGASTNQRHSPLGQSSQELSPISIGLDPGSPFSMPPFSVGADGGGVPPPPPIMGPHGPRAHMSANPDGDNPSGGPSLPFGLNPLPHLLGFQNSAFEGPQRGDQSAHSNHHTVASSQANAEPDMGPSQKVWPKIFRFTDGRINLSDFEKQKKIRLSNKNQHGDNHIESAPIMFDGRQLKRKSFLILHGGVFPGNR